MEDATVHFIWSAGSSGSGTCVTNASGRCTVTSPKINNNKASVTLTVDDVVHATYGFDSGANHDPDGDSDGTSITVGRP